MQVVTNGGKISDGLQRDPSKAKQSRSRSDETRSLNLHTHTNTSSRPVAADPLPRQNSFKRSFVSCGRTQTPPTTLAYMYIYTEKKQTVHNNKQTCFWHQGNI